MLLHREQRIAAHHHRPRSWRSTAERSGYSPRGCIARRRVRSSSKAERRGCSRLYRCGCCTDSRVRAAGSCGSHWPSAIAEGEDALLGARFLFVAARAAESRRRIRLPQGRRAASVVFSSAAAALGPQANGLAPSSMASRLVWTISFDADLRACSGREIRSFRETCSWCRCAAAGTGSGPG